MGSLFGTNIDTLLSIDRVCTLISYSSRCKDIPGEFIEIGAYKGGSSDIIAKYNPNKELYCIDSFEGLPETTKFDFHNRGDFAGVDHVALSGYFKIIRPNVRVIKGFTPDVFDIFGDNQRFAFAFIDVDLYQSVLDCLDFVFPRMSKGGIVLLDDYKQKSTPGCKKAIEEFMEEKECKYHGEVTYADGQTNYQYVIIK